MNRFNATVDGVLKARPGCQAVKDVGVVPTQRWQWVGERDTLTGTCRADGYLTVLCVYTNSYGERRVCFATDGWMQRGSEAMDVSYDVWMKNAVHPTVQASENV